MRTFLCQAKYRRFVEAQLALILAEVGRDIKRREDEDARVQALATIPDTFIDATETGTLVVMVTVPNDLTAHQTDGQLATHLHAMRATPR